ncbi:S8 family serine peptidase [Streptomyces sp. NPDC005122]
MNPRRSTATAALVLCCALLAAPLAGPAYADSPSPGSGADPSSLPLISQVNANFQQQGCMKSSGKTSDRTPWAQSFLRPEGAWQLSRGAGVTVAVLGSGVDGSSGVFDGRLALGPRLPGAGAPGRDCVGHGTFLAGLIAAKRQNGLGFAGIAPEAKILSVAVTDDVGGTSADLLSKGIRAAADGGARVIVVAVPVPGAGRGLQDAVKYADAKGALVIAPAAADSASNSARGGGGAYPSGYPDVLAVSDIGPGGAMPQSQNTTSSRVDMVAPGDSVMSVGPGGAGYFTGTGPSFATAFVAGTAALVLSYRPRLTPEQLLHRLETTAYHPGIVMPDIRLGYGTVDPVAAVTAMLPEEQQTSSAHAAVHDGRSMTMPPVEAQTAGGQAVAVAGGALALAILVGIAGLVLPRGSRRGWRPGTWVAAGNPVDGDQTETGGATLRR